MLLISSSIFPSPQVHGNSFHFQTERCPNSAILIPWPYHYGFIFFWFVSSVSCLFNLQGSHNAPCSSFLKECFHLRSSPLYSYSTCSTSQVLWFSLVCQRSNFVTSSSSVFLPVLSLGSRVEILCQCGRVVTPEDRRPRRFQKIPDVPGSPVYFICACVIYFALHHVIMPSCH